MSDGHDMTLEGDVLTDDSMEDLTPHWNRSSAIIRTHRRPFQKKLSYVLIRLRYGRRYLLKIDTAQRLTLEQILDHGFALCNYLRSIRCARRFFGGYSRAENFQGRTSKIDRYSSQETSKVESVLPRPRFSPDESHSCSMMVRLFTSLFDWIISQRVAAHIESKSQTQAQASESLPCLRKHDHFKSQKTLVITVSLIHQAKGIQGISRKSEWAQPIGRVVEW